jgi:uncharacterized repeat protein (TIGR01451 family)
MKAGKVVFLLMGWLWMVLPNGAHGQANQNEAEWNGNGWSIKKIVSNLSIQSGVNFSYTIVFSVPAGTSTVAIQDQVPPALEIVNVTAAGPVLGVNPVIAWNNVTKLVTYNLSSLPATGPPSGSFTVVVKFKEGVTCNGATARNRVGIQVGGEWMWTPYVSTTAIAANPWIVTKSILTGAVVNPNGGSCGYLINPGDTVTYRLSVTKSNPYYGNVTGQQNASGAVVTDVLPAGAVMVPHPNATFSAGTITWNVNAPTQLLDAANPWAYYWIDIKVVYPAASFPVNTQIPNSATLNATSCNQAITHTSNQTCVQVANIVPNANASFGKYLAMTNRVPGCNGYYYIVLCNNGNVPLTAFNINDAIPAGITVNQVQIYNASATTPVSLNINSTPFATGVTTSGYSTGTLTTPVSQLQLQMTGSLPVGSCLYMYVYFTVNANPTGTIINNCATFVPLSNPLTLNPACVQFTVDAGAPLPCLLKDICSPQSSYEPGDVVRFRLRVQNIGSATLSGTTLQDVLHSNFTYVGNESYYTSSSFNPGCSSGGNPPSGATVWTGVSPSHSGNTLTWSLPPIASNCQLFYTASCGYYGTYGIPYYYIEFDAVVDSFALPGVTPNNYTIAGGNLTSALTSNTVNVLVVASFGQEATKLISTDNGATFAATGTAAPGSNARFRLNYRNLSNVGVTNVRLIDLLGRDDGTNDWMIFSRGTPRGSQFDVSYVGNHTTSLQPAGPAPTPVLQWAAGQNICLPPYVVAFGCNATTWGSTPDKNIRMDYGTSFSLAPSKYLREDFDVGIPTTATNGQTVCNDYAAIASAGFLLNGTPTTVALTPIAAAPVCLTVGQQATCCDSVRVERASGADGTPGCCVKLITTCDVKSVEVTVSNGTLSTASWTCPTPIPTGYAGQTSYTFAPNGCAVELTTCVTPAQAGVVTLSYVINFSNGEKCEKTIDVDCGSPAGCCEKIKLEPVQGDECCARLVTDCEVEKIDVHLTNGVIASAAWNCGTLPSGYVSQSSFTFVAGGCVTDLKLCVTPTQTGMVTIDYVITLTNGEVCEKSIRIECKAPVSTCCALTDFKLKTKWPFWKNQTGIFQITNLDPSSPICYVEISPSPAGSFTTGGLIIDGVPSSVSWTPVRIPASGNLTPGAVNTIDFSLNANGYKGIITLCVVKCDGTRCCFEFKWNSKVIDPIGVDVEINPDKTKLAAVSVTPVVQGPVNGKVKYLSFGLADEQEAAKPEFGFWAISAAPMGDDEYPAHLAKTANAWMGKHHAFFELEPARSSSEPLGYFNLVFAPALPQLGLTLFDEEGNILYSGSIKVNPSDTVTGIVGPDGKGVTGNMFEFINLYPNPSDGSFRITYATGTPREVEIRVMTATGQLILNRMSPERRAGLHEVEMSPARLSPGWYKVILRSEGQILSKSLVIK